MCRCRNPHEARETYKTLRDQNIGGAAAAAELYCQWASLELSAGETCLSAAKQLCCLAMVSLETPCKRCLPTGAHMAPQPSLT